MQQQISDHTKQKFTINNRVSVAGGDINQAYRVSDDNRHFFIKKNRKQLLYMFEAEATALGILANTGAITVPQPIATGVFGNECFLIMSWLNLSGQPAPKSFAEKLSSLHYCQHDQFGFSIDNTIGSTPQINQWSNDWVDFWSKQRLGYQLGLILKNGYSHSIYDAGMKLLEKTPLFFKDYQPQPSLLHGDLWSGNWAADEQGKPVIFDPASYYGDREVDLAMMELFGHPGRRFFDAYNDFYMLDEGYKLRKNFYNLYHILNHTNMFGHSYSKQAENMIEALLAEISWCYDL